MFKIINRRHQTKKLVVGSILVCIAFGFLLMPGAVSAQDTPPVPAAYYGSVTVDGEPAPAGIEVTAELEGTTYGPITTDEDGEFGSPTAGEEKLLVDPAGVPDNNEVTFFVEGQEMNTTVSWESANNEQVDLSVAELPETDGGNDNDGTDNSGGASGSTGGQTGGGQSDTGGDAESGSESAPSNIEQVRSDLAQTSPDREVSVELTDADPERPGLTVNVEDGGTIEQITFGNEGATGTVEIREYQKYPDSVSESISQAVSESLIEGASDTTDNTQPETSVVSVVDITPSDEATANSPATIRMTVEKSKLTNPNNTVILHERENNWEQLDITRRNSSGNRVTLEANVESFSLFTVAETTSLDLNTSTTDASSEETDTTDAETNDGLDGFGLPAIFTALLLVSIVSHRRFNDE